MDLFPAIWVLLAAALSALEIAGRLGLLRLAPLGRTLATLRNRTVGRAALVGLWMWVGWHLFAR